jgi:hypothetical protein
MRSIEPGCFRDHVLGGFGKLSRRRGEWAWFHDVWTFGRVVQKFLNIE